MAALFTFGLLMSFAGIGAMTGATYLASRKTVRGLIKIIPLSIAVFGFGLIAISFSSTLWLSLPLMFIIGSWNDGANGRKQHNHPNHRR